jgi:hypothetical protein
MHVGQRTPVRRGRNRVLLLEFPTTPANYQAGIRPSTTPGLPNDITI